MRWIERAQIDYSDLYVCLYIAYNAWYRKVTQTSFDREAIARLSKRFVIWDDYMQGKTLQSLRPLLMEISNLTKKYGGNGMMPQRWNGVVDDDMDWKNLIRFWYQVRCDLFHGSSTNKIDEEGVRVRLAYLTLNIFMLEITKRMDQCFSTSDLMRLHELDTMLDTPIAATAEMQTKRHMLYQKYIHSHDIWTVDLIRV